jgi:hypothetical protein
MLYRNFAKPRPLASILVDLRIRIYNMKIQLVAYTLLFLLISSCAEKKYKRTKIITDRNLYVEVFTANSLGLNQEYLTDSLTFRIYIGTVDEEHDYYTYQCRGDSLYIKNVLTGNKNCRWEIVQDTLKTVICDTEFVVKKPISIAQLKTNGKFE